MTMPTTDIALALEALVAAFSTDDGITRIEINTGLCADFADAFTSSFGRGSQVIGIDDMAEEALAGRGRFPNASSPPGMTWDALEAVGMSMDLSHTWIFFEGRHFDAEMTEGVDNPFDLPCIRHGLHELLEMREPDLLSRLTEEHGWWMETQRIRLEREPLLFGPSTETAEKAPHL